MQFLSSDPTRLSTSITPNFSNHTLIPPLPSLSKTYSHTHHSFLLPTTHLHTYLSTSPPYLPSIHTLIPPIPILFTTHSVPSTFHPHYNLRPTEPPAGRRHELGESEQANTSLAAFVWLFVAMNTSANKPKSTCLPCLVKCTLGRV